jgi:class 3 adenylate cyclase
MPPFATDSQQKEHAMSPEPTLESLLFDYINAGNAKTRDAIEQRIWETFGMTGAVLVLDMSGFTRTTQDKGIVYYLAMIERMQTIVRPIIEQYGGEVVKFEADNCFARFPAVAKAVDAAIGINIAVAATNRTTPDDVDIGVACGIDHGRFLLVDGGDFWGSPVNRACKLGEDIGAAGDILVTREAVDELEDRARFRLEPGTHAISGLQIEAYRVLR